MIVSLPEYCAAFQNHTNCNCIDSSGCFGILHYHNASRPAGVHQDLQVLLQIDHICYWGGSDSPSYCSVYPGEGVRGWGGVLSVKPAGLQDKNNIKSWISSWVLCSSSRITQIVLTAVGVLEYCSSSESHLSLFRISWWGCKTITRTIVATSVANVANLK